MADGESIASMSLTDALPVMVDGAALFLRVARNDQSEDARAVERWLGRLQPWLVLVHREVQEFRS